MMIVLTTFIVTMPLNLKRHPPGQTNTLPFKVLKIGEKAYQERKVLKTDTLKQQQKTIEVHNEYESRRNMGQQRAKKKNKISQQYYQPINRQENFK